jgi:hypothetical protein
MRLRSHIPLSSSHLLAPSKDFQLTVDLLDNIEPDRRGEDSREGEGPGGLARCREDGDGGTGGHFRLLRVVVVRREDVEYEE